MAVASVPTNPPEDFDENLTVLLLAFRDECRVCDSATPTTTASGGDAWADYMLHTLVQTGYSAPTTDAEFGWSTTALHLCTFEEYLKCILVLFLTEYSDCETTYEERARYMPAAFMYFHRTNVVFPRYLRRLARASLLKSISADVLALARAAMATWDTDERIDGVYQIIYRVVMTAYTHQLQWLSGLSDSVVKSKLLTPSLPRLSKTMKIDYPIACLLRFYALACQS